MVAVPFFCVGGTLSSAVKEEENEEEEEEEEEENKKNPGQTENMGREYL